MNEIELKADEIAREKYFPLDNEDNTEYYNCYCSAMEMYDFAVEKAVKWLEENIAKNTSILYTGPLSINFNGVIEELKKHMQNEQ